MIWVLPNDITNQFLEDLVDLVVPMTDSGHDLGERCVPLSPAHEISSPISTVRRTYLVDGCGLDQFADFMVGNVEVFGNRVRIFPHIEP